MQRLKMMISSTYIFQIRKTKMKLLVIGGVIVIMVTPINQNTVDVEMVKGEVLLGIDPNLIKRKIEKVDIVKVEIIEGVLIAAMTIKAKIEEIIKLVINHMKVID